jgi:hypothetical protein
MNNNIVFVSNEIPNLCVFCGKKDCKYPVLRFEPKEDVAISFPSDENLIKLEKTIRLLSNDY